MAVVFFMPFTPSGLLVPGLITRFKTPGSTSSFYPLVYSSLEEVTYRFKSLNEKILLLLK